MSLRRTRPLFNRTMKMCLFHFKSLDIVTPSIFAQLVMAGNSFPSTSSGGKLWEFFLKWITILNNCCEQCAQLNIIEKILVNCGYAVMQPAHSLFQKIKWNLRFLRHSSFRPISCCGFLHTVPLFHFRNSLQCRRILDARVHIFVFRPPSWIW